MPPWLEYLIFFGFWILIFACPAIVLGWMMWWYKLTPKNVRSLRQALKKKLPLLLVGWDDGRVTFHAPTEILPEGAIKTGDLTFALPRASPDDTPEIKEVLQKRFFMDGSQVWIGYAGKAVAANVKTLAVLEYGDRFNPTFFPVDARTLKTTMPHAWDQMLITALETKADLSGMLKGKKYFGNLVKQWMPLMVILALVIAIIVLAAILL